MWLITNLENVILRYESESGMCRLKIVDGLTHISFGGKDQCAQTVIVIFDLESAMYNEYTHVLRSTDLLESLHDFCVPQFRVPQYRTS